jgi:hypothetical protein
MKKFLSQAFKRFKLPCVTAALVLLVTGGARAGYTVTLEQVGSNVVATGSGTINLTDLTYNSSNMVVAGISPHLGEIVIGPGGLAVDNYTGFTGPTTFGSGGTSLSSGGRGAETTSALSMISVGLSCQQATSPAPRSERAPQPGTTRHSAA